MAKLAQPENGFFYRTVEDFEIDILINQPAEYGMPAYTIGYKGETYKELARIPSMKTFRCQKFLSKRSDTDPYRVGRKKLLVVDATLLAADDWDSDPVTHDAAIKGTAVVRAGVLIDFDDPLPTRPITPSSSAHAMPVVAKQGSEKPTTETKSKSTSEKAPPA